MESNPAIHSMDSGKYRLYEEISRLIMHNNVKELSKIVVRKLDFSDAVFWLVSPSQTPNHGGPNAPTPYWKGTTVHTYGTNIQDIPRGSLTLMHVAAYYDSLDAFVYLESIGFRLNEISAAQYRPIHYGCLNGSLEVCSYVLARMPEEARILPDVEFHLIYLATTSGNARLLRELFACGADISDPRNIRNQPVQKAIEMGHMQCLKVLLEKNPCTQTSKDNTLINVAIKNSRREAIPLLIQSGEDPSVITREKWQHCALEVACFFRQVDVVRELCERLVEVDLPAEMQEKAAVHWICQSHHPEIARIILSKGIDVNRLDGDGHAGPYYMLDIGKEDEIVEIFTLLLQHGLDLNITAPPDKPTNTILGEFVTSITRPLKVIEWLLEHGADPTAKLVSTGQRICDFVRSSTIESESKMIELFDRFMKNTP